VDAASLQNMDATAKRKQQNSNSCMLMSPQGREIHKKRISRAR